MNKQANRFISIIIVIAILISLVNSSITSAFAIQGSPVCLATLECVDEGHYTENEGDSRVFRLDGEYFIGYNPGGYGDPPVSHRNGNTGIDGTAYENGFEVWLARWNYTAENSWAYRTFKLDGKYHSLSGSSSIIKSYNTSDFDATAYFYDGENLLYSFRMTNQEYKFSFNVNVDGVDELKVLIKDNRAAAGGTSFALYNMFLDYNGQTENGVASNSGEFNGHYYEVYDIPMTWTEAKAFCENLGGHLVTVTTEEENEFVFSILENQTMTFYWLGGTDEKNEGEWEWITGEQWAYTNWSVSDPEAIKPNNEGGNQNYLHIYRISVRNNNPKTWNDVTNTAGPEDPMYSLESFGFVCEWESSTRNRQFNVGDIISFGAYPQREETEEKTITELNSLISDDDWKSYNYYSGNHVMGSAEPGSWMRYADIQYNGSYYRAVTFDEYRPYSTDDYHSYGKLTYQDDNGYTPENVYWFKYETLEWQVLDPSSGLVLCKNIIDAQPYNNSIFNLSTTEYDETTGNTSIHLGEAKENNWKVSSLHAFLEDSFYKIAFSDAEKNYIRTVKNENHAKNPDYDFEETEDYVFLLSYEEVIKSNYGFVSSEWEEEDLSRTAMSSDYARCQGVFTSEENGNSDWWLRSIGDSETSACYIDTQGAMRSCNVDNVVMGLRPAIYIDMTQFNSIEEQEIFYENSYIADIWLNQRNPDEETVQSKTIKSILNFGSLSTDLYSNLKEDKAFQRAVLAWKGFGIVFDPAASTKENTFGMTELYETIIFDLLEKTLGNREIQNVILDSVEFLGTSTKAVSSAKKHIDNMLKTIDTSAQALINLDLYKIPKQGIDIEKLVKLDNFSKVCEKYTKNEVVNYLDIFLKEAESVADFFQLVESFQMAVDMADEMKTLLTAMYNSTNELYLKTALNNVISAVDNANWAAFVCTTRFAENTAINVAKALITFAYESNPITATLKLGYDAGKAISNLLANTDGIIDAYYECMAMTNFIDANKKALQSLTNKYLATKNDIDAGSFVYAMRMYQYVYLLDFDCCLNFVKQGSEEGLINVFDKITDKLANTLFKANITRTYDDMLLNRSAIAENLSSEFDYLMNAWKFNELYLKTDYPDIYPIYVKEEYSKDVYAPKILSAQLNDVGKSEILYSLPCFYEDPETKELHVLYGVNVINGLEITENVGGEITTITTDYSYDEKLVSMFNPDMFLSFPKEYSVAAYTNTSKGKVYTKASVQDIENPCKDVKIILLRTEQGTGMGIFDSSPVIYKNIKYHIYRKEVGGNYTEIDSISRLNMFGGRITPYIDKTAEKNKAYVYKVLSDLTFSNGLKITSDYSNEFAVSNSSSDNAIKTVSVIDNRSSVSKIKPSILSMFAITAFAEDEEGIIISWDRFENVDGYDIYRKASFGTYYKPIATVDSNSNKYKDIDAENNIDYEYMVVPFTSVSDCKVYDLSLYAEGKTINYSQISVSSTACEPGEEIVLAVSISGNPGINTFTLGFDYDDSVLQLIKVEPVSELGGQFTYSKKAVWLNGSDTDYNGDILKLYFKVSPDAAPEDTNVTLTYNVGDISNYNEDDIFFEIEPGVVSIQEKQPIPMTTGAPTTEAPTTETPTSKAPTTEAPTSELVWTEIGPVGDVNQDGKINSMDARLTLRFASKQQAATETEKLLADANGDKLVQAKDARLILRYAARLDKAGENGNIILSTIRMVDNGETDPSEGSELETTSTEPLQAPTTVPATQSTTNPALEKPAVYSEITSEEKARFKELALDMWLFNPYLTEEYVNDESDAFLFDSTADNAMTQAMILLNPNTYALFNRYYSDSADELYDFADPSERFDMCVRMSGENVDNLLRDLFGIEPDHDIDNEICYYKDGNYYMSVSLDGTDSFDFFEIDDISRNQDNSFDVTLHLYSVDPGSGNVRDEHVEFNIRAGIIESSGQRNLRIEKLQCYKTKEEKSTPDVSDNYHTRYKGCEYHIPQIARQGSNYESINREIYEKYYTNGAESALIDLEKGIDPSVVYINYEWTVFDSILSLCVYSQTDAASARFYDVYNVGEMRGDACADSYVMSLFDLSEDEFYKATKSAMEKKFYDEHGEKPFSDDFADIWNGALKDTLADENVQKVVPHINSDNELCAIAYIYSIGGAEGYYYDINISEIISSDLHDDVQEAETHK